MGDDHKFSGRIVLAQSLHVDAEVDGLRFKMVFKQQEL